MKDLFVKIKQLKDMKDNCTGKILLNRIKFNEEYAELFAIINEE